MTNYNERLDEIVRNAYSGEISWIHDQLEGTSDFGEALKRVEKDILNTKQAIIALIQQKQLEARIQGIEEAHKEILNTVFTYTHHEEPNFCDVDDVSRVAMSWKVKRIAELEQNLLKELERI